MNSRPTTRNYLFLLLARSALSLRLRCLRRMALPVRQVVIKSGYLSGQF